MVVSEFDTLLTMKPRPLLLLLLLLFAVCCINGCFLNRPESVQNIVKDFNLGWQGDPVNQALYVNIDHTEYGGLKIVEETVFAIAWDQDFIIALQRPNPVEANTLNQSDTIFHIVDIRDYSQRFWGPKDNVYILDNAPEYQQKKKELGVPDLDIMAVEQLN